MDKVRRGLRLCAHILAGLLILGTDDAVAEPSSVALNINHLAFQNKSYLEGNNGRVLKFNLISRSGNNYTRPMTFYYTFNMTGTASLYDCAGASPLANVSRKAVAISGSSLKIRNYHSNSKTDIFLAVNDDILIEGNETSTLESRTTIGSLAQKTATGTILDYGNNDTFAPNESTTCNDDKLCLEL